MAEGRARRLSYSGLQRADVALIHRDASAKLLSITERVAAYYGRQLADLTGRTRRAMFSLPRQVAMLLMYDSSPFVTMEEIGTVLGGRDHSTIVSGLNHIREAIEINEEIARDVATLRSEINIRQRAP